MDSIGADPHFYAFSGSIDKIDKKWIQALESELFLIIAT